MDLGVALVGGLAGGTIAAIIAGIIALVAQGRQHEHERAMASKPRRQERLASTYERMLRHASRVALAAGRTMPVWQDENSLEPPPCTPDDDWTALEAATLVYASPAMVDRWKARRSVRDFNSAAWRIRANKVDPGTFKTDETWGAIEDARKRMFDHVEAFGQAANRELATSKER